jgi:hypothetical protein
MGVFIAGVIVAGVVVGSDFGFREVEVDGHSVKVDLREEVS